VNLYSAFIEVPCKALR